MYKLLIVDDEQMIVDWIYRLFNGLTYLELDIYKANTGIQAMTLMNKMKIDIAILDIHMPEMDGLQLMENICSSWPECKIIFLTGYNQFDYVYTAIQHDNVSYILKTEADSELIKAVEKAISTIEKSIKSSELINKAKQQIGMALPHLQKEYITMLLQGENLYNQQQLDELDIPLICDQPVNLLIGRIDNLSKKLSPVERVQWIYTIKLTIEQYLFVNVSTAYVLYEDTYLVWLIQPANQVSIERTVLFIKETLEKVQRVCMESLNTCLSFAMKKEPNLWCSISEIYYELKHLLNCYIGSNSGIIVTGEDNAEVHQDVLLSSSKAAGSIHSYQNKIGILASFLEQGKKNDFFEIFIEITDYLKKTHSMHFIPAVELYFKLSLQLLSYIGRWGYSEKLAFVIGAHKLTRIDEFNSWTDAVDYLQQVAEAIFKLQESEQEMREKDTIGIVKQYILEHLSEDISLVKLGELVYFNPSYLSRLFKKMSGSNLSDFIHIARINKAKELLLRNDMKIQDVVVAVGYESHAYFTKFFKKMTNMTPQEYRDSLIKM